MFLDGCAAPTKGESSSIEPRQALESVFGEAAAAQLSAVKDILTAEHERVVGKLREENRSLREKVGGFAGGTGGSETPYAAGIHSVKVLSGSLPYGSPPRLPPSFPPPGPPLPAAFVGEVQQAIREFTSGLELQLKDLDLRAASVREQLEAAAAAAAAAADNHKKGLHPPGSPLPGGPSPWGIGVPSKESNPEHSKPSKELVAVAIAAADRSTGTGGGLNFPKFPGTPEPTAVKPTGIRGTEYKSKKLAALAGNSASGSRFENFINSPTFECVSSSLIILNTFIMAVELQYQGIDIGNELELPNFNRTAEESYPGFGDVFILTNVFFTWIFLGELIVRIMAAKFRAVLSPWLWFDGTLVAFSFIEMFDIVGIGIDSRTMRLVRLVRLVRLMKVLRVIAAFDSLFLLLKSIRASLSALVWSFLLLLVVQVTMGMLMGQLLSTFITDESQPMASRRAVFDYFGTFTKTMLTMFEITLANWVPSCRLIVNDVSESYALFWLLYRCLFCFAVLKVITAVFIAETNHVMETDDEVTITKKRRAREIYISKLRIVFNEIDGDGDGELSWDEFKVILEDELLRTWLSTLDIDAHDFETLFALLDDGDGNISIEEFLSRIGSLKGNAKSVDMMAQMKLVQKVSQQLEESLAGAEQQRTKMSQQLEESLTDARQQRTKMSQQLEDLRGPLLGMNGYAHGSSSNGGHAASRG